MPFGGTGDSSVAEIKLLKEEIDLLIRRPLRLQKREARHSAIGVLPEKDQLGKSRCLSRRFGGTGPVFAECSRTRNLKEFVLKSWRSTLTVRLHNPPEPQLFSAGLSRKVELDNVNNLSDQRSEISPDHAIPSLRN